MNVGKLVEPAPLDPVENAIETCELIIEEGIQVLEDIRAERYVSKSHRGEEYDAAYEQGRKDTCRVILLCLRGSEHITSDDVRREA